MGTVYASVSDITALGISLTAAQSDAATILLGTASSKLRLAAKKHGKDLDAMIAADPDCGDVVKNTVVQAVIRALNSLSDTDPAVSQVSQSGLGYSASMTYFNAGQSLYFLRNELKDLGLMRQSYGALEVYGNGSDASGN